MRLLPWTGETGGTQGTDGVMKLAARGQRFTLSRQLRPRAGQTASGCWVPHLGEHRDLTDLRMPFLSRSSSEVSRLAAAQCGTERVSGGNPSCRATALSICYWPLIFLSM